MSIAKKSRTYSEANPVRYFEEDETVELVGFVLAIEIARSEDASASLFR